MADQQQIEEIKQDLQAIIDKLKSADLSFVIAFSEPFFIDIPDKIYVAVDEKIKTIGTNALKGNKYTDWVLNNIEFFGE